jgi:hypothetical protein
MFQSWAIKVQEEFAAFLFHMETDHGCFMTLAPEARHAPKTAELGDTNTMIFAT